MSIDRAKALKAAQKYLAKGQIDRAITEYEQLIALDGGDARWLLKLGDLYARQGNNKSAITSFRKVAARYAEQGFFLKAVSIYKQILKLDPSDLVATEGLATMYEKLTLVSDALATYEQLADAYVHVGKPEKALLALGKVAELDPKNVAAWIRSAEALSKADRIDEAVEAFCRGADLLKRLGRLEDYIKVSERLLFHTHDHLDRARELAAIYIERGQAKAALAHLQTCFKADPRNAATLGLLARAFTQMDQSQKAISVYRELARVLAEAGQIDAEVDALKAILALDPNDSAAHQGLKRLAAAGAAMNAEADDDESLIDETDALVMEDEEPADVPVRLSVPPAGEIERQALIARLMAECEVFVRYGLRDKIVAQLGRVLELDPNHVEAREKLKDAYVKRGETKEAISQLVRLAEIVGADAVMARAYIAEATVLQPDDQVLAARLIELKAAAAEQDEEVVFVDDEETENRDSTPADVSEVRSQISVSPNREESFASLLADDDDPELVLEDATEGFELGTDDAPTVEQPRPLVAASDAQAEHELPDGVAEALEEADFYLAQELTDEAREALNDALAEHPDHPALLAKLAEFDAGTSAAESAVSAPPEPANASAALAAKIAQEAATGTQGPAGVEQALKQFREGVRRQVDNSDTATHYDLGIAYMQMGLHAEAIEAFTLCLETVGKRCTAHTMIGLSHVANGDMTSGVVHFKQALASSDCNPGEEVGLWFEIGNASELSGKASEALVWYEKVEEQDPGFRDVSARIERLGVAKTPQQEGDDFDNLFDSMILKD